MGFFKQLQNLIIFIVYCTVIKYADINLVLCPQKLEKDKEIQLSLTWCFCLFLLSCSIFCCFSSFSVMRASLTDCFLGLLYALKLRAVSSVVDRLEQYRTSALSCFWNSSSLRALSSIMALRRLLSDTTLDTLSNSWIRCAMRDFSLVT